MSGPAPGPRTNVGGRPPRTDVTPAQVRALKRQGLSFHEIARQLRAGYGTVRKAYQRADDATDVSENPSMETL